VYAHTQAQRFYACITSGTRLLIFRRPVSPVARATSSNGDHLKRARRPDDGVLREAAEETGLSGLLLTKTRLGEQERDMARLRGLLRVP